MTDFEKMKKDLTDKKIKYTIHEFPNGLKYICITLTGMTFWFWSTGLLMK